jgi:small conductance mechanosensitive channel
VLEAMGDYIQAVWHSTLMTRLVHAILVAVVFEVLILLSRSWLKKAFKRVLARDPSRDATMRVLRRRVVLGVPMALTQAVLVGTGLLVMLRYLGFQVGAEIVPVGLVLVLTGLVAFHNSLADAAAGYLILYDALFGVGDRISLGDTTGEVVQMGLRTTQLLTTDGRHVTLPNRLVRGVTNHTRAKAGDSQSKQYRDGVDRH